MVEISYRAARAGDAAAIAAIHVASWRDAYAAILAPAFLAGPIEEDRRSLWATRLGNAPPSQWVETAEHPEQGLIGFICAYRDADAQWGSLVDNLHVLPAWRGHSIGERLLRTVAGQLRQQGAVGGLHLWVFEANEPGLRFYLRLGGEVVERDVSRIAAAAGKIVLRVHWPTLDALS